VSIWGSMLSVGLSLLVIAGLVVAIISENSKLECDVLKIETVRHCTSGDFASAPRCRIIYSNGLARTTGLRIEGEKERVCWKKGQVYSKP